MYGFGGSDDEARDPTVTVYGHSYSRHRRLRVVWGLLSLAFPVGSQRICPHQRSFIKDHWVVNIPSPRLCPGILQASPPRLALFFVH